MRLAAPSYAVLVSSSEDRLRPCLALKEDSGNVEEAETLANA